MRAESGDHEAVNMDPGVPSQEENSKCLAELNNVLRHQDLDLEETGELLNKKIDWEDWKAGGQDLNLKEIRELLNNKINGRQWKGALQKLLEKDLYFMVDGRFREKKDQEDLKTFLQRLLFDCVEDDLEEHLKVMIDWLKELSEKVSQLDTIFKPRHYNDGKKKEEEKEEKAEEGKEEKCFYENNFAMRRACKKRNIATVFVLFKAGFRLKTRLEKVVDSLELTDDQLTADVSILKARASPAYLLAETKQDNFMDPITKAMELIRICEKLVKTRRGAIKKVENVRKDLEKFLVKMLDLCRPRPTLEETEVGLFLNQG